MECVRQEIIFSGRVQGVGFRYSAQRIADHHDLTGWVKNLPDGTVQVVAEGNLVEIDRFIENIRAQFNARRVGQVESLQRSSDQTATGEFKSFFIR